MYFGTYLVDGIDSADNLIAFDNEMRAWKFDEQELDFKPLKLDLFGGLNLKESWQITCYKFTDYRASLLGGRCILSSWVITIVVDFENFDVSMPVELVHRRKYLYSPNYIYQDRVPVTLVVTYRMNVFSDFSNDLVVLGFRIEDFSQRIFIFDLQTESMFPFTSFTNNRYNNDYKIVPIKILEKELLGGEYEHTIYKISQDNLASNWDISRLLTRLTPSKKPPKKWNIKQASFSSSLDEQNKIL